MAQQTAVDWLVQKYFADYNVLIPELEYEQAKQMEKEQIKHAFLIGGQQGFLSASKEEYMNFEQYYNEIYLK